MTRAYAWVSNQFCKKKKFQLSKSGVSQSLPSWIINVVFDLENQNKGDLNKKLKLKQSAKGSIIKTNPIIKSVETLDQ